jgi:hypothetical protein
MALLECAADVAPLTYTERVERETYPLDDSLDKLLDGPIDCRCRIDAVYGSVKVDTLPNIYAT